MEALTPYLVALVIQVTYTGMFLITKLAFDVGMNTFVFVFYRQLFGAAILTPVAFFLERKTAPHFTFKTFAMLFVVCLFGMTISLNLYGVGVRLTNATLAAAASNSLPVSTFILALIFRMEKVKLKKMTGIVKIIGVCLCAGGAATIALYTGPTLKLLLHHHLFNLHGRHVSQSSSSSGNKWILGVFLTFFSNVLWSLWIVIQSRVLRRYPSKLLSTTIQACISSIQTFVVALIFERDFHQWKLGLNIRLLAVAYCGIVVTGLAFYLQTWVVQKKGPVFLSVTTPLALIFTMAFSAFFFGSILSLGSIMGAVFLIGGLYCVMWGKSKEQKLLASNDHTANPTVGSEKGYESTEETNAPTPGPHPARLSTSEV